MASSFDQIKSIIALPFMTIVVIPISILCIVAELEFKPIIDLNQSTNYFLGIFFLLLGVPLFVQSIVLFVKIGNGTLAPWNPTKKLVIKSLYRYMRNPMILGVFFILLAESFLFNSSYLLVWSLIFLFVNHLYFILKEEPELLKRFEKNIRNIKIMYLGGLQE